MDIESNGGAERHKITREEADQAAREARERAAKLLKRAAARRGESVDETDETKPSNEDRISQAQRSKIAAIARRRAIEVSIKDGTYQTKKSAGELEQGYFEDKYDLGELEGIRKELADKNE